MAVLSKLLLCVASGTVFGVALHKANVMDPTVIRGQMLMQQFTMLKFFMSALASSALSLSLLSVASCTKNAFAVASKDYFDKLTIRSIGSSLFGGALMGLGMTISGSCSSSIFPQLGALVPNAQYTFLGALSAVFVYSLTKSFWDNLFEPKTKESFWNNLFKPKIGECQPWTGSAYLYRALPLVAVLGAGAYGFEKLIPSENEIKLLSKAGANVLAYNVWPPYVCGLLVGALQVPLVVGVERTLGGSTSMSVLAAQVFVGPLKDKAPAYLAKLRSGFQSTWQIYYAAGAVLGGYISAKAAGTVGKASGVSPLASFWGGFLLYAGTRIGGGCTSGHGLSGNGLLSPLSFLMIGSTFATAILSAFILDHAKLL